MATHLLSSAWFPNEIFEEIILATWSSSLTVDERILFMTSSHLVSKAWMHASLLVFSRDVYIPCSSYSYAHQFFRILRKECPIYSKSTHEFLESRCRSLTLQVRNTPRNGYTPHYFLHIIYHLGYLPNLRRVSIEYLNWKSGDLFDHYELSHFPEQVTELDLKFLFNRGGISEKGVEEPYRSPCILSSIRRLSVTGAPDNIMSDLFLICPNVENVVRDGETISISS